VFGVLQRFQVNPGDQERAILLIRRELARAAGRAPGFVSQRLVIVADGHLLALFVFADRAHAERALPRIRAWPTSQPDGLLAEGAPIVVGQVHARPRDAALAVIDLRPRRQRGRPATAVGVRSGVGCDAGCENWCE
jgi:hypothetical protein